MLPHAIRLAALVPLLAGAAGVLNSAGAPRCSMRWPRRRVLGGLTRQAGLAFATPPPDHLLALGLERGVYPRSGPGAAACPGAAPDGPRGPG